MVDVLKGYKLSLFIAMFLSLLSVLCPVAEATVSDPGCSNYLGDSESITTESRLSWFANPDWSGNTSIPSPIDGSVVVSDVHHPIPTKIFFSVAEIKSLPTDMQILINQMKVSSKPLTKDEVEMGALVARYADGTSRNVRFTSHLIDFILGPDLEKAISESEIFPIKEKMLVKVVFHLHTHPDLKNPIFGGRRTLILPSIFDYELWLTLRSQLRQNHPGVSFQGIVAPLGAQVDNIVFVIKDEHLDAYEKSKLSMLIDKE